MKEKPVDVTALPRWMRTWERFWFTPMDPTLLGAVRIVTGLIVVYTLIAYSFSLQEMMGEHAWVYLKLRQQIAKKLGEEAVEALIEGIRGDKPKLVGESADMLYHLLTLWASLGVKPRTVWAELARREGLSGIAEKAARKSK